ncbi:hypothetical protein GCM10012278_47730 [Nonomuraea glycinis]|uniref:Uncharacterized protein n=1 Tax=Nonomuraea glycinis TaxID=2047744 RepID=A0A918E7H5_9ACTN|nr:hypothetical protein GCM10012278_47730 [Nonomuraea glycinis]
MPALGCISVIREELYDLVDQLPESELRFAVELIRGRLGETDDERDLPFFASFESEPDLAERHQEILRTECCRLSTRMEQAKAVRTRQAGRRTDPGGWGGGVECPPNLPAESGGTTKQGG